MLFCATYWRKEVEAGVYWRKEVNFVSRSELWFIRVGWPIFKCSYRVCRLPSHRCCNASSRKWSIITMAFACCLLTRGLLLACFGKALEGKVWQDENESGYVYPPGSMHSHLSLLVEPWIQCTHRWGYMNSHVYFSSPIQWISSMEPELKPVQSMNYA